jgi:quinol monooxygenase YgiN
VLEAAAATRSDRVDGVRTEAADSGRSSGSCPRRATIGNHRRARGPDRNRPFGATASPCVSDAGVGAAHEIESEENAMSFTQMMTVRTDDADRLQSLIAGWHDEQHGTAPGYRGARILSDREQPDRWLIEVDFSSREEAERNNERPETAAWAQDLRDLVEGAPDYHDYEVTFTTT